jgi:carbon storage regulator
MLVLTRKKSQEIVIAENIVVTVVEISGDKVRLGIAAPKEVAVHRQEIYDKIKESRRDEDARQQDAVSGE